MPYKDPPKSQITWQQAVVVLGLAGMLMTSVTILALRGKDVSAVLSAVGGIVLVVGGMFGFSLHNKVDRVETMANGRLTAQMEANQKLHEQVKALALLVQPQTLEQAQSLAPPVSPAATDPSSATTVQ